ncbi:MAG TPA: response regulator [Verrucomicrobiota bacterium]|nr:response regulator [Verrucomicrobiota bacterium]
METRKPTILIIEDDDMQYEIYEDSLSSSYRILRAKKGSEAIEIVKKEIPDLIILDHILEGGEYGLDYLPEIKEALPFVPIIIVSGALEVHQRFMALQGPRRAHYCLTKPLDLKELKRVIEIALKECGDQEIIRQFEALERSRRIDAQELVSRSVDRLSRQTEIKKLLANAKERPNISALARHFKVARKTIIRDLRELIRRGELSHEIYPASELQKEEDSSEN